jgi:hypothetical protein
MTLTIDELNGKYRVTTVTDYQGPVPMKSDGVTEIKNGQTHRTDAAGVQWSTQFTVVNDEEVKMVATADPSGAAKDFLLTKEDGTLTHDPVVYTTPLKVMRKGGKICLSGNIIHGKISTLLTMMKIE